MILPALLSACRTAAVELSLNGESIRLRGPAGALTPELRQQLKAHKPEVIDSLRNPVHWDAARASAALADCETILDAGLPGLTPPQARVTEAFRDLARRYVEQHDPELWAHAETIRRQFARWKRERAARATLEALDR